MWPASEPPGSSTPLQPLSSAEGRFRIGLPAKDEDPDLDKNSESKRYNWFLLNIGRFQVLYLDRDFALDTPDVRQSIFDSYRNRGLSHGKLVSDSEMTLAGHPGREFRVTNEAGTQIDRIFLAGNRIYILSVFVPEGLSCKLDSAVKILDTFEIIDE